ncbi:hypothetical protein KCV06_g169, partial [Aureobasidium melanogenum]
MLDVQAEPALICDKVTRLPEETEGLGRPAVRGHELRVPVAGLSVRGSLGRWFRPSFSIAYRRQVDIIMPWQDPLSETRARVLRLCIIKKGVSLSIKHQAPSPSPPQSKLLKQEANPEASRAILALSAINPDDKINVCSCLPRTTHHTLA